MTASSVRERLQALPPDLPNEPGRFDRVRDGVRRRRRRRVAGAAAGAVVLVAVSVPVAVRLSSGSDRGLAPTTPSPSVDSSSAVPGVDAVTPVGPPRTQEGIGTLTVDLGDRPADATSASITLTCLTAGRVRWPNGSASSCSATSIGSTASDVLELAPGQDELVFTADDGVEWRVVTTYVHVEPTEWGVNANGDTYGARNDRGEPDLIAASATNGRRGYVYADELDSLSGGDVRTPEEALQWQSEHAGEQVTIPVYESDGETVIGEFTIGPVVDREE